MANIISGNLAFIDTASATLDINYITDIIIDSAIVGSSSIVHLGYVRAAATFVTIIKFTRAPNESSVHYKFNENPLYFPNGLRIVTLTNAEITIIFDRSKEKV